MGNRIQTVIFDLDGTLSDSSILTMAAFNNFLPSFGLPLPTIEAVRRATGNPNPEFYYILFPDIERHIVDKAGSLIEQEELRLLPSLGGKLLFNNCLELLKRLKENNIRLCIASTGDEGHVFSVMNETGITGFFETILCGHPDKTETIRKLISTGNKSEYIMVGDMKKDHEGAAANGILSVGACYGYCRRELTKFDLYIDSPLDLLGIIKLQKE